MPQAWRTSEVGSHWLTGHHDHDAVRLQEHLLGCWLTQRMPWWQLGLGRWGPFLTTSARFGGRIRRRCVIADFRRATSERPLSNRRPPAATMPACPRGRAGSLRRSPIDRAWLPGNSPCAGTGCPSYAIRPGVCRRPGSRATPESWGLGLAIADASRGHNRHGRHLPRSQASGRLVAFVASMPRPVRRSSARPQAS